MRAIAYDAFGPAADVLKLEDMPTPAPGPGEVLVRLKTSGVNPSDVRARAGGRRDHQSPRSKIIPHSDGAGIIEAVGEGVASSRIGERVWIWNGQWQRAHGTAADYIALPTEQAVPLPESCSFEQGAVLGIPGLTATHAVLAGGVVDGQWIFGQRGCRYRRTSGRSNCRCQRGSGDCDCQGCGWDKGGASGRCNPCV